MPSPKYGGRDINDRRETLAALESFYMCPPDGLREEVPSPESFLIMMASARS